MSDEYFKRFSALFILVFLLVITFFMMRPILMALIFGVLLGAVMLPADARLAKWIKSSTARSTLICSLLILLILVPTVLLMPVMVTQSVRFYFSVRSIDFVGPLQTLFPQYFQSGNFALQAAETIHRFIIHITDQLSQDFSAFVLNIPILSLQVFVALMATFYLIKDHESLTSYIKSLLPFSKEVEKKLFENTKAITFAVLYGQIIVGILQGIIIGLGFFIFGVPNALFLTLIACVAGILPLIGTAIVYIPVSVYLLIGGSTTSVIGILIFGIISSSIEHFLRPMFVTKKVKIPTAVVLTGMIGGIFVFGVLGFILGPLVLAYLLIILEIYRDKRNGSADPFSGNN